MATKIILTSEPSSGKFNDRVLLFDQEEGRLTRANQREVRVSRSSTEENPDTYNAVFECRVITLYYYGISVFQVLIQCKKLYFK